MLLGEAISRSDSLECFRMDSCDVTNNGIFEFQNFLFENLSLKVISLSGCLVSPVAEAAVLSEARANMFLDMIVQSPLSVDVRQLDDEVRVDINVINVFLPFINILHVTNMRIYKQI